MTEEQNLSEYTGRKSGCAFIEIVCKCIIHSFSRQLYFVVYFDILQVAKWPRRQLFYELFADHPTLGFSFSVDTSPELSAVVVEVAATQMLLEPALAATAVTQPEVATATATAVTQPGVASASAASLVDDWISSSESDSDDIQVGAKRPPTPATPIAN